MKNAHTIVERVLVKKLKLEEIEFDEDEAGDSQ